MQANRKKKFRLNDHKVVIIHDFLYSPKKYPFIIASIVLYSTIILLWSEYFEVSANYFVILPLIVFAVSFGLKGGIAAGLLALPFNLLLFRITGHSEYAPDSLVMAELSGLIVGSILGYLSDFFTLMKEEVRRRRESEKALEKSLREKEILLKEINHRVKNNLNLIKSLVQLQTNRLSNGETRDILIKMRDRIISIAMVQDLLYEQESLEILDLRTYLQELTGTLLEGFHNWNIEFHLETGDDPILLNSRKVTSLGIMINEIITNASKHVLPEKGMAHLTIRLWEDEGMIHLSFRDNGLGYPPETEASGLGFKLIRSLLTGLKGHMDIVNKNGGELTLHFPGEE